jgi:hypothetical protein
MKYLNESHRKQITEITLAWANKNKIEINKKAGKSQFMDLNSKQKLKNRESVQGITHCTEYKYLGYTLQANGKSTRVRT